MPMGALPARPWVLRSYPQVNIILVLEYSVEWYRYTDLNQPISSVNGVYLSLHLCTLYEIQCTLLCLKLFYILWLIWHQFVTKWLTHLHILEEFLVMNPGETKKCFDWVDTESCTFQFFCLVKRYKCICSILHTEVTAFHLIVFNIFTLLCCSEHW